MLDSSRTGSVGAEQAGLALAALTLPSWGCRAEASPLQLWLEACSLSLSPSVMDLILALIHTPSTLLFSGPWHSPPKL